MDDKKEVAQESSMTTVASIAQINIARKNAKQPPNYPIALAVDRYISSLRGIAQTAQIALPHITQWKKSEVENLQRRIEKYVPALPKKGEEPVAVALESARDLADFTSLIRDIQDLQATRSTAILSRSLFTQLFAEFDSYTGELLKVIYLKNDKLLKGISREIALSDLLDFDDLNSVKISMLEKEIETFRRDSYIEQFSNLEKKFGISLKKFKEWPEFVELSQRRNILTHNGGAVSDQYLAVCEREGYKFSSRPKTGTPLDVGFDYFFSAGRLLSKVGIMLAYTLWMKVFPKETKELHSQLNNTIYNCLLQKRWNFVAELKDFVLGEPMRREISEIDLRIRIVNMSIALKFSNMESDAIELLDSVDWTATYRDFKLAIAVLKEQYDVAVDLMKSIGKTGEIIRQPDYHTWPLFSRFRERSDFYDAYFEVYGEAFSEKIETTKGAFEAHAKTADSGMSGDNVETVEHNDVVVEPPKKRMRSVKIAAAGKPARKKAQSVETIDPIEVIELPKTRVLRAKTTASGKSAQKDK